MLLFLTRLLFPCVSCPCRQFSNDHPERGRPEDRIVLRDLKLAGAADKLTLEQVAENIKIAARMQKGGA